MRQPTLLARIMLVVATGAVATGALAQDPSAAAAQGTSAAPAAPVQPAPPEPPLRFTGISANLNGPGPATTVRVKITVERWSTPDEKAALAAALKDKGTEGLVDAMSKLDVGTIQVGNRLGWTLRLASTGVTPKGRLVRVVTDRPIAFVEVRDAARSMDYPIGIVEFTLPEGGGEGQGALLLACKAKFDENGQLVLESLPGNTGPQPFNKIKQEVVTPKKDKKD